MADHCTVVSSEPSVVSMNFDLQVPVPVTGRVLGDECGPVAGHRLERARGRCGRVVVLELRLRDRRRQRIDHVVRVGRAEVLATGVDGRMPQVVDALQDLARGVRDVGVWPVLAAIDDVEVVAAARRSRNPSRYASLPATPSPRPNSSMRWCCAMRVRLGDGNIVRVDVQPGDAIVQQAALAARRCRAQVRLVVVHRDVGQRVRVLAGVEIGPHGAGDAVLVADQRGSCPRGKGRTWAYRVDSSREVPVAVRRQDREVLLAGELHRVVGVFRSGELAGSTSARPSTAPRAAACSWCRRSDRTATRRRESSTTPTSAWRRIS